MLAGTGIVLAGGKSRRFGTDKALAILDGVTLIERVLGVLRGLFPANLVVVRDAGRYRFLAGPGVRVVPDRFRESHGLGGIYSGLLRARTRHCFVTSCDQPLLQPRLLRALWNMRRGCDAVVPCFAGHLQPLCAVYSRVCLKPIGNMIRDGNLRIRDLFARVRTRLAVEEVERADPEGLSFLDVDTKADLARLRRSTK